MDKFCFVGLGNPGEKYKLTRHNAGFIVIDYLKEYFNLKDYQNFKSEVDFFEKNLGDVRVYFVKPLLFMNNSGLAVKRFCEYNSLTVINLIIIYDDVDIEIGRIRIREKGSSGGHNGMESVIKNFKTDEISRIRIGIGPKPDNVDLSDYVLSDFTSFEKQRFDTFIAKFPEIINSFVSAGIKKTMNVFNK
ncbi:MAG: aminoacyl-tRNA hydrolase [Elusimicrobiota bacterium]